MRLGALTMSCVTTLRRKGMKLTPQRRLILDIIHDSNDHLTANEILDYVQARVSGVNKSTIYRTLDLLVRAGFINRFTSGDGQNRYEFKSDKEKEHHHHLTCIKCRKIIDYNDFVDEELELVKKTEETLAKRHKFNVLGHNIEFYGLCDKCK